MQSSLTKRDSKATTSTSPTRAPSGGGGDSRGLRGLDFESGARMLAPSQESGGTNSPSAPVRLSRGLPKPNLKSRLLGSTYTRVYALYSKVQKAKRGEGRALLEQLKAALEEWAGRKDESDERKPEVLALLDEVVSKLHAPPSPSGETTSESQTAPTTVPTTTTQVTPPTTTPPESTTTAPTTTPTTTTPESTPTTTTPESTTTPTTPESTTTTSQTPTVTPEPTTSNEPAWKQDRSILLPTAEIVRLSYDDCLLYLDSRPQAHVESLGRDNQFVGYAIGFDVEKTAQIAVRLILRTPDAVVERGASRAEAIRILTSQLRDKGIIRRLLSAEVRVVIVPANRLMTDLPEFAAQRGTYTFDGRPWDTVRGLGGQNTAITEENLLGIGQLDSSIGRKGWRDQTSMDNAIRTGNVAPNEAGRDGPTDSDAVMNNPGVYCDGYSTTNHEFFHTIHMFGLSRQDNQLIEREYNTKKSQPNTAQWADGPRLMPDGTTPSENYSSSTVYEYFAQTGCAFQGTNVGTDPYTGNTRNNGRSWVTANEPGLAGLLSRVCSDTELRNVNPTTARRAQEQQRNNPQPQPNGQTTTTQGQTGPQGQAPRTPSGPPPVTDTAMGFIQEK